MKDKQQIDADVARLIAAGLKADAARKVARHPTGGPVVLAPGVIISLFPIRESREVAA